MIVGGYILKPRIIQDSDISDCSPCVRETWDYLIREANHKDYKNGKFEIKRGQLFRTYDEILDALSWNVGWRKKTYTENQMKQAMKNLREHGRITTQKKPGGVLITICKYDFYQNPDNYEQTTESTTEETIEKPLKNHRQTSHNYKNEKNVKNEKNISPLVSDYSNIKSMEEPLTVEQGESLVEEYGATAVKEILMQMENWKPLKKKNKSANLTAQNWLKRRTNGHSETEFDPEAAKRFRGAFK